MAQALAVLRPNRCLGAFYPSTTSRVVPLPMLRIGRQDQKNSFRTLRRTDRPSGSR